MEQVIFVETLDQQGNVRSRVRLNSFPVTIGRSYTNDIILDDPYVCPQHASITVDSNGNLSIQDLGSVNGIYEPPSPKRTSHIALSSETKIRLGRTILRFCRPDHTVPTTFVDRASHAGIQTFATSPAATLGISTTALVLFTADAYLGSYERGNFSTILSQSLLFVVVLAVWAGCWSLASRMITHNFRYLTHLALTCGAAMGFMALAAGSIWLNFLFPGEQFLWLVEPVFDLLLFSLLLYGHFSFASSMASKRRWSSSFISSGVIIVLALLLEYADHNKFTVGLDYPAVLKSIDARWLPTVSLDEFMKDARHLKEKVDLLAKKSDKNS